MSTEGQKPVRPAGRACSVGDQAARGSAGGWLRAARRARRRSPVAMWVHVTSGCIPDLRAWLLPPPPYLPTPFPTRGQIPCLAQPEFGTPHPFL